MKAESTNDGSAESSSFYHERQHLQQCAVHAVNNLVPSSLFIRHRKLICFLLQLQEEHFHPKDFDEITETLCPSQSIFSVNPHKSVW